MKILHAVVIGALLFLAGCTNSTVEVVHTEHQSAIDSRGQLFDGMGDYHRPFTTSSEQANKFMVQGMIWAQAFNHDEAVRSFREAAKLDPECAMAWWGLAYASGPNYIIPSMTKEAEELAWESLSHANAHIENTSPVERGLIEALSKRYANPAPEDRTELDLAYADAMEDLWRRFPSDADVGVLYAEARMILRPNKLYDENLLPVEGTKEIVADLEKVLAFAPNHPGACHFHIHSLELSANPRLALPSADRLSTLVPVSGHMLHMPTHIYIHSDQWDRAVELNALAMKADDQYRKHSPDQFVQHLYMIHNNHLLVFAAMMSGREREAIAAARKMWTDFPEDQLEQLGPLLDRWMCSVYDVQKRFGRWDDLLGEPAPPDVLPITCAMWRAHRAVAYAAKKEFQSAGHEFDEFLNIYKNLPSERLAPGQTPIGVQGRLEVIKHFVPGEIALQQNQLKVAIGHLQKAVEVEDSLGFNGEPPDYMQPIRHTLGAVYLKAKQYEDAVKIYREDLAEFPGNGWSLYGLSRALEGHGKAEEAKKAMSQFETAWDKADQPLSTSCKCIPEL